MIALSSRTEVELDILSLNQILVLRILHINIRIMSEHILRRIGILSHGDKPKSGFVVKPLYVSDLSLGRYTVTAAHSSGLYYL
jgi:hypothetical protein